MDQEKLLKSVVRIHAYGRPIDFCKPFLSADRFKGVGTGFVVQPPPHADTSHIYVVTCAHVVDGADSVSIMLPLLGMNEYPASVLALIPNFDIAVVAIPNTQGDLDQKTIPLQLGTSHDLKMGQKLVAVGYPLGQTGIKVSDGVYSGFQDKLQHTVSISPGNSGGPLIDEKHTVVGINSSGIVSPEASNIGFAVPIELYTSRTKHVFQLKPGTPAPERVLRQPIFGFGFAPITRSHSKIIGACVGEHGGVQIVFILQGSEMAKHMHTGDILVEFDGMPIDTIGEVEVPWTSQRVTLQNVLERAVDVEKEYQIKFWSQSKGTCQNASIKPNLVTQNGMRKLHPPHDVTPYTTVLGMIIMPLLANHSLCPQLIHTYSTKNPEQLNTPSLVVCHVYNGTIAQIQGPTQIGDEIAVVNGIPVTNLEEFDNALPKVQEINQHKVVTIQTTDGKTFMVNSLDALQCENNARKENLYVPNPGFLAAVSTQRS